MNASLLIVAGLSVAILSIPAANAASKTRKPQTASTTIFSAAHTKVLDPDIRLYAPAKATTYKECQDQLREQGVGTTYMFWVCGSVGYKS